VSEEARVRGFHTVTPQLVCKNAAAAIEFYGRAFGAEELARVERSDGKIMHADLRIGDSILWVCDEQPQFGIRSPRTMGGSSVTLHLYVLEVDAVHARALAAGATEVEPVSDRFWGDRLGRVADPFGHRWSIATRIRDVSPRRVREIVAEMGGA